MITNSITFFKPDYYDDFSCIGSECKHNCCDYYWNIAVDKTTYKKYKNYRGDKSLEETFKNYVRQNDFAQTKHAYASIIQNREEHDSAVITHCPFQDSNGLCEIHKHMGEKALSRTCKIFPRISHSLFHSNSNTQKHFYVNQFLSAGCEVLPTHFLKHKEPIGFVSETIDMTQNEYAADLALHLQKEFHSNQREILEYFYDILNAFVAVLQCRDLCFENRLIVLGLVCNKLDEIEKSGDIQNLPSILDDFISSIDTDSFAEQFKGVEGDYKQQLIICLETFFKPAVMQNPEAMFNEYLRQIRTNALNYDEIISQKSATLTVDDYVKKLDNYNNIMHDKQHFLENLFVSHFLATGLPFIHGDSFYRAYQFGVIFYITFRFAIMYYIGEDQNICDNDLIDLTVLWTRTVGHSPSFNKVVEKNFRETNHTLAEIVRLIK